MTETITIPGGVYLPEILDKTTFKPLMAWFERNGVNPYAVTAERDVVISGTIDRWEIIDDDPTRTYPNGYARHSGYQLQPGEEWSNDQEHAMAVRPASSPITEPLPDNLRAALVAALAKATP